MKIVESWVLNVHMAIHFTSLSTFYDLKYSEYKWKIRDHKQH